MSKTDNRHEARLRLSPYFASAADPSGRPYIAQETEPYTHYWLTDRYRLLLSMFAGRRGARSSEAIDAYRRCTRAPHSERRRLQGAVAKMRSAGILQAPGDDSSRYDAAVVSDYLTHRPFPPAVAAHLVKEGRIGEGRRVLDLAGGPGDLAVQLATTGADVTLLELSRAFLKAAGDRARAADVRLRLQHDSCNRLLFREEHYDVVVIAQALHWMDDVAVCRGLYRLLDDGGSFFVVYTMNEITPRHPIAPILGKQRPFRESVRALTRRLKLLFQALDTTGVDRVDLAQEEETHGGGPIELVGGWEFRDRRPLTLGFARAYFTRKHVTDHMTALGVDEETFWKDLRTRYERASARAIVGTERWAVLHFRRRAPRQRKP